MSPIFKGYFSHIYTKGNFIASKWYILTKGIGFSVNTVNNYVNIYFTMILAYSIIYLIVSINSELPWQNCHPSWKEKSKIEKLYRLAFYFIFTVKLKRLRRFLELA